MARVISGMTAVTAGLMLRGGGPERFQADCKQSARSSSLFDRMIHALSKRSVDGTSTCPNAGLNVPLSAIML
jgi:hypothetical protein